MSAPGSVLVVGTGLIGTSVGLALRGAAEVLIHDDDDAHLRSAAARGAGTAWDGRTAVDLALVCVPPAATGSLVSHLIRSDVATTVSHVASTQSRVQLEVETGLPSADLPRVCGGHPMAGREVRGPGAATARLFLDRPWAVCPSEHTSAAAVSAVRWLAHTTGALPLELSPAEHDAAVALVSHLPQVAASALAARLLTGEGGDRALALAGPGVQDATRIAASDTALWVDVLRGNARHVAPLVRQLARDLAGAADALDGLADDPDDPDAAGALRDLLERGARGRGSLPLKQRSGDRVLASVLVGLPDRPGQLAAVLTSAAGAGVNVEDVRVEHLPGRPRGLLELVLDSAQAEHARRALAAAGFEVVEG